jgi:hypothetical protein
MTEYDRLITHLKNLQSKNIKQATFDVNWLAQTLGIAQPVAPAPASKTLIMPPRLDIDGGIFSED